MKSSLCGTNNFPSTRLGGLTDGGEKLSSAPCMGRGSATTFPQRKTFLWCDETWCSEIMPHSSEWYFPTTAFSLRGLEAARRAGATQQAPCSRVRDHSPHARPSGISLVEAAYQHRRPVVATHTGSYPQRVAVHTAVSSLSWSVPLRSPLKVYIFQTLQLAGR